MKYMILGGGGVFANHLAKHLLDKWEEVVAVGRGKRKECFSLGVGEGNKNYQYHQIHIVREMDRLLALIKAEKPDFIINFAALAYANSWDAPELFYNTNLMAPVALLQHTKDIKFVQISSSEVYGSTITPATEDAPLNPTSPYAVSKLATDLHLKTLDQPFNIVRPSNCYGEGQYTYRIIPKAILYMLKGKPFPLQGGGIAEKSFMHAQDLANAVETICFYGRQGETYNVGSDLPISMRGLVEEVRRQLGFGEIEVAEGRAKEDSKYWIDSSKMKLLGWRPRVDLERGIAGMIEWCYKYKEDLMQEPDTYELRA